MCEEGLKHSSRLRTGEVTSVMSGIGVFSRCGHGNSARTKR